MAAVPLLSDTSNSKTPTVRSRFGRWAGILSAAITGKDELTTACEKVGSTQSNSYSPKEKHLIYLMERVSEDPAGIEDILLRFNGLTNWSSSPVVTIKILFCTHHIIRRVPHAVLCKADALIIFISEIRDRWSSESVPFIDQYAGLLLQYVQLAKQHYQLFDNVFARGMGLAVGISFFDTEEILIFTTKLMSFQDRLLALLRLPEFPSLTSQKETLAAHRGTLQIIVEQSKLVLSLTQFLVLHLQGLRSTREDVPDVVYLREQLDEQDNLLQAIGRGI